MKIFKWDGFTAPAYSPDIAPSDYLLFQWKQHDLAGHWFTSFGEIKWLQTKISSKDKLFFQDGIQKLSERWQIGGKKL